MIVPEEGVFWLVTKVQNLFVQQPSTNDMVPLCNFAGAFSPRHLSYKRKDVNGVVDVGVFVFHKYLQVFIVSS